jgi:hypothetical protein
MLKYLISGLAVGTSIPLYLSDRNYLAMWNGIYRPHIAHRERKRQIKVSQQRINEYDYLLYLTDIATSAFEMIKVFLYKGKRDFELAKQNTSLNLTMNFEFINETINNYDEINRNIQRINDMQVEKNRKLNQLVNTKPEDMNLQNIQLMREKAKDDYQKYALDNSVMTKEEKIRSQNVFEIYASQLKNIRGNVEQDRAKQEFEFYNRQDNITQGEIRGTNIKRAARDDLYKSTRIKTYEQMQKEKLENEVEQMKELYEAKKK